MTRARVASGLRHSEVCLGSASLSPLLVRFRLEVSTRCRYLTEMLQDAGTWRDTSKRLTPVVLRSFTRYKSSAPSSTFAIPTKEGHHAMVDEVLVPLV